MMGEFSSSEFPQHLSRTLARPSEIVGDLSLGIEMKIRV